MGICFSHVSVLSTISIALSYIRLFKATGKGRVAPGHNCVEYAEFNSDVHYPKMSSHELHRTLNVGA